jgi:putative transposase
MNTRNRTSSEYIGYGLYFYFSGLSLRKTSERLSSCFIKGEIMYVSIWNWIQKYKPKKIFERKKKIEEFIVDETLIKKIGSELIWLWVATIELGSKEILGISISKERNICS